MLRPTATTPPTPSSSSTRTKTTTPRRAHPPTRHVTGSPVVCEYDHSGVSDSSSVVSASGSPVAGQLGEGVRQRRPDAADRVPVLPAALLDQPQLGAGVLPRERHRCRPGPWYSCADGTQRPSVRARRIGCHLYRPVHRDLGTRRQLCRRPGRTDSPEHGHGRPPADPDFGGVFTGRRLCQQRPGCRRGQQQRCDRTAGTHCQLF